MGISFEEERKELQLGVGIHNVYITGGFSIKTEQGFSVTVMNISTGKFVQLKNTIRLRSLQDGFKCVKMYSFEINDSGIYEVQIINPQRIKVKSSMLMSKNLFLRQPKNKDLNIIISKN